MDISVYIRDIIVAPCRFLVAFWLLPFRQPDARPRGLFIWNQAQQMRDTVEACAAFVISGHDVPRRDFSISCGDHHVPCARVVVPAPMCLEVHRAQLPDFAPIVDPRNETASLLLLANLEPV